jgi:hypothetical protein
MEDITDKFREFAETHEIEIEHADGPSPPNNLQDDGIQLGEFLTQNEKAMFERLTTAFEEDLLNHDTDWDPLQVSFRAERPTAFKNRSRAKPKEGPNLNDTLESWIHFPATHVEWMNVSQMFLCPGLRLTCTTRTRSARLLFSRAICGHLIL